MDIVNMAPLSPPHVLSSGNTALFDVVVQYADMDMLRALALTAHSFYDALQKCQFEHLTMVVLEAPILDTQQQVAYNGADPVSIDVFKMSLDAIVASQFQTQGQDSALPNAQALHDWREGCVIRNDFDHNLNMPDYARNFMARAQSVELVVYRLRLGTRISAFFTNNARHFKHGQHMVADECTSCVESDGPTHTNTQHKRHLHCLTTPPTQHWHCNADDKHPREDSVDPLSDKRCVFSRHCSHEYAGGGVTEYVRLMRHMIHDHDEHQSSNFPFAGLPSLQLRAPHHTPHVVLENDPESDLAPSTTATRIIHSTIDNSHTSNDPDPDGHLSITTDRRHTRVYRPRFQNLPHAEQHAPTTSLKIRIADCMSFGVEDWCDAIPGCTAQPLQTWIIHDDASTHDRHQVDLAVHAGPDGFFERAPDITSRNICSDEDNNIGHHFPHLTNLVLHYTRLDVVNRCGIGADQPDLYADVACDPACDQERRLTDFFIDGDIRMPHLHRFGVIGTMLDAEQYAMIAHHNAHTSWLNINPGFEFTNYAATMRWMAKLTIDLDTLEDSDVEETPSIGTEDDGAEQPDAPQQLHHHETGQQTETAHPKRQTRPYRKYNFSIDFASSYLESCCPHKTDTLTQRALGQQGNDTSAAVSRVFSQFGQHQLTCDSIHDALSELYWADRGDGEMYCRMTVTESLDFLVRYPSTVATEGLVSVFAIVSLAQRVLTYLELRCLYCSHANPSYTVFPGACPGDCTATELPPSATTPLDTDDLPQDKDAFMRVRSTRPNKEMYMRLRQLLHIPPHVVLRL